MAPSPTQLLIVAFIILLLFGTTRLSELGKGLGEGIRNFKKGIQDDDPEEEKSAKADEKPAPRKNRLPPRKADATDAETHEEEADEHA
jgi:sec-independent protein translocase protein TatA